MSVLPAAVASVQTALEVVNPMDELIASVNSSPYVVGTMMLLLNLGGRFLSMEVTPGQEKILSHPYVRRFFLIVVLFVATRNIVVAVGFGIIVIILLGFLFNEKSDLCIWRSCHLSAEDEMAQSKKEGFGNQGLTPEEKTILDTLLRKRDNFEQNNVKEVPMKKPEASVLYSKSLSKLRSLFL